MDYFGRKYDRLPGDVKRRNLNHNHQEVESWEGNLSSNDKLLQAKKELSEVLPDRNFKLQYLFQFVSLLFVLILIGRLWQLQVIKGAESLKQAEGNIIHVKTNYAPRGVIYDRQNQVIAGNTSRYDLKVIPALLPEDDGQRLATYQEISEITSISVSDLSFIAEKDGLKNWNELVIRSNLDRDQSLFIKSKTIPGFFVQTISSRKYYCDQECAHILGYTGLVDQQTLDGDEAYQSIDQIGKSGLEIYYEKELKGVNGAEYRIVDASGEIIQTLSPKASQPGENIYTTLDTDLQKHIFQSLSDKLATLPKATGGSVVVTDVNSGEILSLVNYPSFSINSMTKGLTQEEYDNLLNDSKLPLFNRAISGEYPPGSTFKIVTASAILAEKIADINTFINDQGSLRIVNKYDPSIIYIFWSWDHSGLGPVNVVQALTLSSDIYFYIFGGGYEEYQGLGIEKLKKYAEKYLLSKTLGIDLIGERPGFIPSPTWKKETKNEEWYLGDDYNTAIGQGDILVTPLQVNAYTQAIANGGKIYRPHLLKTIKTSDGKIIQDIKPEIISDNIIDQNNLDIIREGLRAVVTDGTAKILQNAIVPVAGKTGTAQYYNNEKEHAWFTCYAPADNPQIAITVFVEGGGEGSDSAAPLALDIVNYYFSSRPTDPASSNQ